MEFTEKPVKEKRKACPEVAKEWVKNVKTSLIQRKAVAKSGEK